MRNLLRFCLVPTISPCTMCITMEIASATAHRIITLLLLAVGVGAGSGCAVVVVVVGSQQNKLLELGYCFYRFMLFRFFRKFTSTFNKRLCRSAQSAPCTLSKCSGALEYITLRLMVSTSILLNARHVKKLPFVSFRCDFVANRFECVSMAGWTMDICSATLV